MFFAIDESEDFYWENGKYNGRDLGIDGYKDFIHSQITKAYEAGSNQPENKSTNKEIIAGLQTQIKHLQEDLKKAHYVRVKTLKELGFSFRDSLSTDIVKFIIKNSCPNLRVEAVPKEDLIKFINKIK